jgi:hypothetical protein
LVRLCDMGDRWLNEYRTLVEWYLQEKSEVLLFVPVSTSHIPRGEITLGFALYLKRRHNFRGVFRVRLLGPTD